jgi:hypothetical protein
VRTRDGRRRHSIEQSDIPFSCFVCVVVACIAPSTAVLIGQVPDVSYSIEERAQAPVCNSVVVFNRLSAFSRCTDRVDGLRRPSAGFRITS